MMGHQKVTAASEGKKGIGSNCRSAREKELADASVQSAVAVLRGKQGVSAVLSVAHAETLMWGAGLCLNPVTSSMQLCRFTHSFTYHWKLYSS